MIAEIALVLAAAGAQPAEPAWHERYRQGVALIDQEHYFEARRELEAALRLRAQEGLQVHTVGPYYVDYLPHLYLAVACHGQGAMDAARKHLAAARRSGLAARSEVGAPLLEEYTRLLEPPGQAEAAKPARPRFNDYPRRPGTLPEQRVEELKTEVLGRCHLSPGTEKSAPWYFHYELALELARHGDNQRALDALIEAATRRSESQHAARIYGVWFIDYLPYFNIARAHSRLGNWECAADALTVSQRMGEVRRGDRRYEELQELAREIGLRVKK